MDAEVGLASVPLDKHGKFEDASNMGSRDAPLRIDAAAPPPPSSERHAAPETTSNAPSSVSLRVQEKKRSPEEAEEGSSLEVQRPRGNGRLCERLGVSMGQPSRNSAPPLATDSAVEAATTATTGGPSQAIAPVASTSSQLLRPSAHQRSTRRVRSSSPSMNQDHAMSADRWADTLSNLATEVLPAPPSLPYDVLYAPLAPPAGIDPKLLAQAGIPVANLSALAHGVHPGATNAPLSTTSAPGPSPASATSTVNSTYSAPKMKRLAAKQTLQSHMASEKRGQMPMPWGLRTTILERKRANGTTAKTRMGTMKRFPPPSERTKVTLTKGAGGEALRNKAFLGAKAGDIAAADRRSEASQARPGGASRVTADGAAAPQKFSSFAVTFPDGQTMKNGAIDTQSLQASVRDVDGSGGGGDDSQATTPVVPLLEIGQDEDDEEEEREGSNEGGGSRIIAQVNGDATKVNGGAALKANGEQSSSEMEVDETAFSSPVARSQSGSRGTGLASSSEGADAEDASLIEMDLAAVAKRSHPLPKRPNSNGTMTPAVEAITGVPDHGSSPDAVRELPKPKEEETETDLSTSASQEQEQGPAAEAASQGKKKRGRPRNGQDATPDSAAAASALGLASGVQSVDASSSPSTDDSTLTRRPRDAHKRIRLSGGYYNKGKLTTVASSPSPSPKPPATAAEEDRGADGDRSAHEADADPADSVILDSPAPAVSIAATVATTATKRSGRSSTPALVESNITPTSTKSLRGMSGQQSSSPSKLIHASGGKASGKLRAGTRGSSTASSTSKATPTKGAHGLVAAANGLDDTGGNNEFCDTCEGRGHFICCDGCPRSFHFNCVNPPLEIDELPEGEHWFCRVCRAEGKDGSGSNSAKDRHSAAMAKKRKASRGVFDALLRHTEVSNPTIFSLPLEIRNYFKGVATSADGSYTDSSMLRPIKLNKAGFVDERDPYRLKDRNGKAVLCYRCGGSALPQDGVPLQVKDEEPRHEQPSTNRGGVPGRRAARRALSMIANPEASSIRGKGRESSAQEAIENSTSSTDPSSHPQLLGEPSSRQRREEQGWRKMVSCDFCSSHWHLDCVGPVPMVGLPSLARKWMCPNHTDHLVRLDRIPKNVANATTVYDLPVPSEKTVGAGKHYRTRVVNDGLIDIIPDPFDTFFGDETGAGKGGERGWDAAPGTSSVVDADASSKATGASTTPPSSSMVIPIAATQVNNNAKLKFRIPEKVIRLDWWQRVKEDRNRQQQLREQREMPRETGKQNGGRLERRPGQDVLVPASYNGLDLLAVIAAANSATSSDEAVKGKERDDSIFIDGTSPADLVRLALTPQVAPRYRPTEDDPRASLPSRREKRAAPGEPQEEEDEDIKWWKEGDEEASSIRSSFRPGEWEGDFEGGEGGGSSTNTAPSISSPTSSNTFSKKEPVTSTTAQHLPDDAALDSEELRSLRAVRQLLHVKGSQKLLDFLMAP